MPNNKYHVTIIATRCLVVEVCAHDRSEAYHKAEHGGWDDANIKSNEAMSYEVYGVKEA